tara:strand:- start:30573 stop:31478 length:906 start_codon:yes stop_codon:yes gene_type:complete
MTKEPKGEKAGFVALLGRTNSGKSTLLNSILGYKLSITSRKPQTTRNRLIGIKTKELNQTIYVDTPGFHSDHQRLLNNTMNRIAKNTINNVDIILFMVDVNRVTQEDMNLITSLGRNNNNKFLLLNKVDKTKNKDRILPLIDKVASLTNFDEIIPISALKGENLVLLEELIEEYLPKGPHLYPKDQITDLSERFLVSEIIREKSINRVGDEIPYRLAVMVEEFKRVNSIVYIDAIIYVEKRSQKGIVIGNSGKKLKSIGTSARKEIENLLDTKVMLKMWVKIKPGWSDNEKLISNMGYGSK